MANDTSISSWTPIQHRILRVLRQISADEISFYLDSSLFLFCDDFNAHARNWGSRPTKDRGEIMCDFLTHRFFRADTGAEPTRPANCVDSLMTEGSIIDHIVGTYVDLCHAKCHSLIAKTRYHRSISAILVPTASSAGQSTKYWPC